jgi:hypothetical protein
VPFHTDKFALCLPVLPGQSVGRFFKREVTTERNLQEHQRGCFAEENTEPGAGQQEAPCRGLQGILSPPVVFIVLVAAVSQDVRVGIWCRVHRILN